LKFRGILEGHVSRRFCKEFKPFGIHRLNFIKKAQKTYGIEMYFLKKIMQKEGTVLIFKVINLLKYVNNFYERNAPIIIVEIR
jgi:hypothetical protein